MKNIGVNDGHTLAGTGTGAVGIIKESEHTRLVGNEVRRLLTERGHKAINCTIDHAKSTAEGLELIINQSNRQELDWFVSIHFNAGGGRGVEVYTYQGKQYEDAVEVCKAVANLGFINRGVKEGSGLYVIRKTKAKSMLIEVCFVDTVDAQHYLKIGHKKVAKAIVDAMVGYVEASSSSAQNKQVVIPSDLKYGIITASVLNVRNGRGTSFKVIGQLKKGAKVKLCYLLNGWWSIDYGSNIGYVSAEYIG